MMVNTVITTELYKYLVIGTPVTPARLNKSRKLSRVGFFTKIVGGKAYSSPMGLNAWLMIKMTGSTINTPKGINIM
jgi:hypothetical protein